MTTTHPIIEAPPLAASNPFELVAFLFFKVRSSLEEPGTSDRPPRWVRILRAREAKGDPIADGIGTLLGGLGNGLSYIAELCLDIEELLVQTDAGKALLEVSLDLIAAATSDAFITGINDIIGPSSPIRPIGEDVTSAFAAIGRTLRYVPEPEDIARLSHELYRLLCVEQLPMPRKSDGTIDIETIRRDGLYVDLERSGKMRLMQWGYGNALKVHGLGPRNAPESESLDIRRLGTRWLWQPGDLPGRTLAQWPATDPRFTLYELVYDARAEEDLRAADLVEVHGILAALGYTDGSITEPEKRQFSTKLAYLLRQFQYINGLPRTGELDNPTLNRLLNMDFMAKRLARARPFDPVKLDSVEVPVAHEVRGGYLEVINHDADHPEDERIVVQARAGYSYYECGVGSAGKGWIRHQAEGYIPGFVALQSRRRVDGNGNSEANFEGGILSEGEAASGKFFFCARFTEPWVAGRSGEPVAGPLFGNSKPSSGSRTLIFQWLPIAHLWLGKPADSDLVLSASVLRRSLYTDRSKETCLPDQGSITLAIYAAGVYQGLATPFPRAGLMSSETSGRFPGQDAATALMTLPQVERSRLWVVQSTPELVVPEGAVAVMVSLEGFYQSGYDIDAYFDNVTVRWDYRKTNR